MFASEGEQVGYLLPKPPPDGCQVLHLTLLKPLEKTRASIGSTNYVSGVWTDDVGWNSEQIETKFGQILAEIFMKRKL